MTWFSQARSEGMPISGPVIQIQAKKFHRDIHGEDLTFFASGGWLNRFKQQHGIKQVSIRGEQRSADEEAAESYPGVLRELLLNEGPSLEQVYNCDETGLYYKMLPDKTLAQKSDDKKTLGFKQSKDRVTVLLCCNKTGNHKLMPLVIGKFGKPRCFHHININSLPAKYSFSKNAWMTTTIFEEWFHKEFVPSVRKHLRRNKKEGKAILLMDHCPAHPGIDSLTSTDKKIRAVFLPKNTTSKIQPLDQGIIAAFKRNYRRNLTVMMVDSRMTVSDYLRSLNLKEAIYLLGQAWNDVTKRSINGCWNKGLGDAFQDDESDSDFDGFAPEDVIEAEKRMKENEDIDLRTAREVFGLEISKKSLDQWTRVDDDAPTFEKLTDKEIIQQVTEADETLEEDDETKDVAPLQ